MILCQRDLTRRICHNIMNLTIISNCLINMGLIGDRLGIGNRRCNLRIHIRFQDDRVKVCLLTHFWGKPMRDAIKYHQIHNYI
jgi:hypothetical protein